MSIANGDLLISSDGQIKLTLDTVDSRLDTAPVAATQSQVNSSTRDTEDLKRTVNNLDKEVRSKTIRITGLSPTQTSSRLDKTKQ